MKKLFTTFIFVLLLGSPMAHENIITDYINELLESKNKPSAVKLPKTALEAVAQYVGFMQLSPWDLKVSLGSLRMVKLEASIEMMRLMLIGELVKGLEYGFRKPGAKELKDGTRDLMLNALNRAINRLCHVDKAILQDLIDAALDRLNEAEPVEARHIELVLAHIKHRTGDTYDVGDIQAASLGQVNEALATTKLGTYGHATEYFPTPTYHGWKRRRLQQPAFHRGGIKRHKHHRRRAKRQMQGFRVMRAGPGACAGFGKCHMGHKGSNCRRNMQLKHGIAPESFAKWRRCRPGTRGCHGGHHGGRHGHGMRGGGRGHRFHGHGKRGRHHGGRGRH